MDALTYSWFTYLQRRFDKVDAALQSIQAKEKIMAGTLDALTAQVAATLGAEHDAIADILALAQAVAAALAKPTVDPAQLASLVTQLQTSATALAAATTSNQPPPVGP